MAQKMTITHEDDIDGKPITDNDAPTVSFSLDGTEYEIDLSDKNQEKLRKALEPYITAGRKVGRKPSTKRKATQLGPSAREIRDWARSNGYEVPIRGRIPSEIREAFDAAS